MFCCVYGFVFFSVYISFSYHVRFGMLIFCLLRLICKVMLCFVMLCSACFAFLLSFCFHVLFSVMLLYCLFHFSRDGKLWFLDSQTATEKGIKNRPIGQHSRKWKVSQSEKVKSGRLSLCFIMRMFCYVYGLLCFCFCYGFAVSRDPGRNKEYAICQHSRKHLLFCLQFLFVSCMGL